MRHLRLSRDEDGAAAVEFVLIFTFLFVPMVFGLISMGINFNDKLSLTQGVREAARYGATTPYTAGSEYAFMDAIRSTAIGDTDGQMSSSSISYCVGFKTPAGVQYHINQTDTSAQTGTCSDNNGNAITQDTGTVLVTALKPATLQMVVWPLLSFTMESTSVARYETSS